MSFLKKIFGNDNNINENPSNEVKIKRTIFDFFKIDLKNIPDDSFVKAETVTNITGDIVQNYRKTLDYKECGIFDTVEVIVIGDKGKNIIFKTFQPKNVKIDYLKNLIDELYLIHGNDALDKGKCNNDEIEDYFSSEWYAVFGRMWTDSEKYKNPVLITRDENELSISIWGVEKE
jgi:hypothetical protein